MANLRLLLAVMVAAATLAGCTSSPQTDLSSIYDADLQQQQLPAPLAELTGVDNVTVIAGDHFEVRLNEGSWGKNSTVESAATTLNSPTMTSPEPLGGGGEVTALSLNASGEVEVRLAEHAQLAGYTAWWTFTTGNTTEGPFATPADGVYEHRLPAAGPFVVTAWLSQSEDDKTPVAVYLQPLVGHVMGRWTITGAVQPQSPPSLPVGGAPWPTDRMDMVDSYTIELPAGVTVTATTVFDGSYTPDQGTDVDIGLYNPAGTGIECSAGNLAPTAPVDPSQATEKFAFPTDEAGIWSVQIGAMQNGCPVLGGEGGSFSYTNAGPVPYKLDIILS